MIDRLRDLAARANRLASNIQTEEACKNAFIMPMLGALGYDVFNPEEVVPEFVADVGIKKGEKVDYAVRKDGKIIMLIECKWNGKALVVEHASQLLLERAQLVELRLAKHLADEVHVGRGVGAEREERERAVAKVVEDVSEVGAVAVDEDGAVRVVCEREAPREHCREEARGGRRGSGRDGEDGWRRVVVGACGWRGGGGRAGARVPERCERAHRSVARGEADVDAEVAELARAAVAAVDRRRVAAQPNAHEQRVDAGAVEHAADVERDHAGRRGGGWGGDGGAVGRGRGRGCGR